MEDNDLMILYKQVCKRLDEVLAENEQLREDCLLLADDIEQLEMEYEDLYNDIEFERELYRDWDDD